MVHVLRDRQKNTCNGHTRRDFLQIGALGMGGLTLPGLLRARAATAAAGRARRNTSVVWLWLGGGASHVETFDPKMSAPAGFRSTVGAARTNVPGIELGGVFTKMAKVADKMAFVRSFGHGNFGHGGATHWLMTGHDYPPADQGLDQNNPGMGAIVARHRGPNNPATHLPTYIRLGGILGDGTSWLGTPYAPFDVAGDAYTNFDPQLTLEGWQERRSLTHSFASLQRRIDQGRITEGLDGYQTQALDLLANRAGEVFDLTREDRPTLALYGTSALARQMLLARRLCEAGAGFVTIHFGGWDMHGQIAQGMTQLGPQLDHAAAAFVADVAERGLQDHILLVITGEFGRTPRLNVNAGRDHWAPLSTLALAGGGLRMGQVVGQSSAKAEVPRTTPITPQDLMATVFHVLGIPQDVKYNDPSGRPTAMLNGGKPIGELL